MDNHTSPGRIGQTAQDLKEYASLRVDSFRLSLIDNLSTFFNSLFGVFILIVLLGISALYLLLRCRRLQSSPAAAAGMLGILFSLLGMCALSALVGVVFDFSTILAALSLVVFAVYDITAIFAAMERHPADSAADWAMALRAAQQERGRGLIVNTLMVSAVLLSITVGAYHSDMTALTAFSFPLTAGLAFALYAGLVLVPLLWYEFRFGRESRTEPDSAE